LNDLTIAEPIAVDVAQFNAQYNNTLTVKESIKFHDRFLIIDKTTLIHGMRRRNALRFGGKICRRQTRRAPKRPRRLPQPPRQEVFRLLIPRQIQHPRHSGEDVNTMQKTIKPAKPANLQIPEKEFPHLFLEMRFGTIRAEPIKGLYSTREALPMRRGGFDRKVEAPCIFGLK